MAGFTLHFKKPAAWADSIFIHYWHAGPKGLSSTWPGVSMTAEGDGWFTYRFAESAAHFVFNDGQGQQSVDYHRGVDGWLDETWCWHHRKPIAEKTSASAKPVAAKPIPLAQLTLKPIHERTDFREETIYFLLTTRFYDGDPSNNFFCRDRIQFNAQGESP